MCRKINRKALTHVFSFFKQHRHQRVSYDKSGDVRPQSLLITFEIWNKNLDDDIPAQLPSAYRLR